MSEYVTLGEARRQRDEVAAHRSHLTGHARATDRGGRLR